MNHPIYITARCRKHKTQFAVELRPAGGRLGVHRILTGPGAGLASPTVVSPDQVDWERFCCPSCGDSYVVQCGYPDCQTLMCHPRRAGFFAVFTLFRCPGCNRPLSGLPVAV